MTKTTFSPAAKEALWAAQTERGGLLYLLSDERWSYLDAHGRPHTLADEDAQALLDAELIQRDPSWLNGASHAYFCTGRPTW